jgi:hypothetical protein
MYLKVFKFIQATEGRTSSTTVGSEAEYSASIFVRGIDYM